MNDGLLNKKIQELKQKASALPFLPGVYLMKSAQGSIIYIGKAKKLRNRVSQYFRNISAHNIKVHEMVVKVSDFDYIITDNEFEALVLECSLIKEYKPKYNILLKDDKGFYYLKITNEIWPRIKCTKTKFNDNARYIGPYTSIGFVTHIFNDAIKIFKLPNCNRNFSTKNNKKNQRPCLNYYIGQCLGPCIGKISLENYLEIINKAELFLRKCDNKIASKIEKEMLLAAKRLDFEKAARLRDQLFTIKKLEENNQKVILDKEKSGSHFDVISLAIIDINDKKSVSCFKILNYFDGKLCNSSEYIVHDIISTPNYARTEFLQQYYSKNNQKVPDTILLDGDFEYKESFQKWIESIKGNKVKIKIPKNGKEFEIVQMCLNNAKQILKQKIELNKKNYEENDKNKVLRELKELLNLDDIPKSIEAFDISNLKNCDVVGGMIVINDGKINKSLYKKFKIKTINIQDDYKSMQEMVTRRLNEHEKAKKNCLINGFETLPDIMLLDGGKGHVAAIKPIVKKFNLKFPVFGMVKDEFHKTRALVSENLEYKLNKNSDLYKFIYNIQEEVHRYSINYHITLRKKSTEISFIDDIPGVGEKTAKKLLHNFKTMENIKKANIESLEKSGGIKKSIAEKIYNYFNQKK